MSIRPAFPCLSALVLALAVLAGSPDVAEAQFGRRLKDAVKRTAEDKAIQKATEEESEAIDGALSGSGGEAEGPDASAPTANAAAPAPAPAAAAGGDVTALRPGEGAWANYDFKPGERVLFTDDFTRDEVGDFPRRLELREGNMEIVEWQGSRYLRGTSWGILYVPLPEALPERFTMEFDYSGPGGWNLVVEFDGNEDRHDGTYVLVNPYRGGLDGELRSQSEPSRDLSKKVFPVRIMADGKYVKVYLDDKRVGNAPNADVGRAKRIMIHFGASDDAPVMIGNIRVAAGGKKLYDALAETGRVATQGIYFDTGSDRIRPESTPTLKEIGAMLKDHPELGLVIEGHTDNVGSAEANQALSEKRAAAVRQFLINTYQVDGARLVAKGLGQSAPVTSNDTPEGRQQNRRVELVKN